MMQCTEEYLISGERSRRLHILCACPRSNFQAYPPAWDPPPKAAMEAREFIHVRLHYCMMYKDWESNSVAKEIVPVMKTLYGNLLPRKIYEKMVKIDEV